MASDHIDIFEIYARYCDIVSTSDRASSKELLNMLSKSLELRVKRDEIVAELSKLMSCLQMSVDSHQFYCFYDFVFFACREDGQKNITVTRAISAWRFVLAGRFRLLNQWCDFVEEHQKHNISEDVWQQLLAFSRCVNEDLDGYDPKGAWPVLIDDFVEHMYRINPSNNHSTREFSCSCKDMEAPVITGTFGGLNILPGFKRKLAMDMDIDDQYDTKPMSYEDNASSDYWMTPKRAKLMEEVFKNLDVCDGRIDSEAVEKNRHNLHKCLQTSPPSACAVPPSACAVEDCLSKGFAGHLSISCLPISHYLKSRLSFT